MDFKLKSLIPLAISCIALGVALFNYFDGEKLHSQLHNMQASISPLLSAVPKHLCESTLDIMKSGNVGGHVMYRAAPEIAPSSEELTCSQMYARCWIRNYDSESMIETKKILADIPLEGVYTCLDPSKIEIPYVEDEINQLKVGEVYTKRWGKSS